MLPPPLAPRQRQSGESATFLVEINVQCTAVGLYACVLNLCLSSSSVIVFGDCFSLLQLELFTGFHFLRQTIPHSYCSWQEVVIIQTSSCFQCMKITRVLRL